MFNTLQLGRIMLVAAAAAWLLAGLMPEGLRVCRQAGGNVELGLGCPCDACNTEQETTPCCSPDGCYAHNSSPGLTSIEICCTCSELAVLPSVDSVRDGELSRVDVLLGSIDHLDYHSTAISQRMALRVYEAHAPPGAWDPASICLLI